MPQPGGPRPAPSGFRSGWSLRSLLSIPHLEPGILALGLSGIAEEVAGLVSCAPGFWHLEVLCPIYFSILKVLLLLYLHSSYQNLLWALELTLTLGVSFFKEPAFPSTPSSHFYPTQGEVLFLRAPILFCSAPYLPLCSYYPILLKCPFPVYDPQEMLRSLKKEAVIPLHWS